MPRARNIKPSFFKNEDLSELPFEARLLFIGLWTLADREGYLEYRPKRIKAELFPYDDVDCPRLALGLTQAGLIQVLNVGGIEVIYIPTFTKHQHPHHREMRSEIAIKIKDLGVSPRPALGWPQASLGKARLNPDILNPDILNPDIMNPDIMNPEYIGHCPGQALGKPQATDAKKPKKTRGVKNENPAKPITDNHSKDTMPEAYYALAGQYGISGRDAHNRWGEFFNYWAYECPSSKRRKVDWLATWRNNLERMSGGRRGGGAKPSKADAVNAALAAIDEGRF